MEIKNKNILVLGGWGLVGSAIIKMLLPKKPALITIASLTEEQARNACKEFQSIATKTKFVPAWGNIFVRNEMKDLSRSEILENRHNRLTLAEDVLERTTVTSFKKFFLYRLIVKNKPHIIIDCVNTATGVAYQDIYSAGLRVLEGVKKLKDGQIPEEFTEEVEKLLGTLYMPQLVRHVQILYRAMKVVKTGSYVKIGTSGTGGMGLNIPYTHSEDKPSRVLLSKTSIAGAHSLLLFLIARTPDAPFVKEVKPATAIAWKRIEYGEILKGGKPVPIFDCLPENAIKLKDEFKSSGPENLSDLGRNLKSVFIDTGENGTFSLGEFTAITTNQQMEYITPEEIAQTVLWEIEGGATGHDVVGALDASILSSTYRAGIMRSIAIQKMKALVEENGNDNSIAFELLGPPRLSKLLFEIHLLKLAFVCIDEILKTTPDDLSKKIEAIILENVNIRSRIISIGIPILMPDGKRLIRGQAVKVPQDPRQNVFDITDEKVENWASNGWVDLRVKNMMKWKNRLQELISQADQIPSTDTSSTHLRDFAFWQKDSALDEGEIVGWLFIHEDEGKRMK